MLTDDEVHGLLRANKFDEVHDRLDAALPGNTPDDRHSIACWRTSALLKERRYAAALDHLQQSKADFGSKTLVHHYRASIFDILGRDSEALHELRTAPLAAEMEKYWPLVLDAKFYLLHFMAKRNMPVEAAALDEIPEGYISVLPSETNLYGAHVSKEDLKALIGAGHRGT